MKSSIHAAVCDTGEETDIYALAVIERVGNYCLLS